MVEHLSWTCQGLMVEWSVEAPKGSLMLPRWDMTTTFHSPSEVHLVVEAPVTSVAEVKLKTAGRGT